MKKNLLVGILFFLTISSFAQLPDVPDIPRELEILEKYYYFAISSLEYNKDLQLWEMVIGRTNTQATLYWKNGCLLPIEFIDKAEEFEPIFSYEYPFYIPDPELFTNQEIENILDYALSTDSERQAPKSLTFFFNAVYNGTNYKTIVNNLISIYFLGQVVSVQKMLWPTLKQIQAEIYEAAKSDTSIQVFLDNIHSLGGYNPRTIAGNNNRSIHSWGIALDILPKNNKKHIYWEWSRRSYGKKWVTIPLKNKWMPPEKVIQIFEKYGFIWGGKWEIWDNMHFEYRPEIITYRNEKIFMK